MTRVLAFLGFLAVVLLVVSIRAYRHRVSGTWLEAVGDGPPERVVLRQIGPWIRGRKSVPGGWQSYAGTFNGVRLKLKRRDHGVDFLTGQGFPLEIARKLDGTVMAHLELAITVDGRKLSGAFYPQKIEFKKTPPRILNRYYLEPVRRTWARGAPG